MAEGNGKQCSLNSGPACEKEELVIEVIGNDHPEGHQFRIFDTDNQEQQEWLEDQVEQEALDGRVLHVWDWRGQPGRNFWLEVDSSEGAPVRLPFLEDATAKPRGARSYIILPVLPTTMLSGITRETGYTPANNPGYPVLSRPGYLYIFNGRKLWRELEVRLDEYGSTSFHDVRLSDHRNEDDEIADGDRPVVGEALDEVWLPMRTGTGQVALDVAFSESPLPAARLRKLESDAGQRVRRCTRVNMDPNNFNYATAELNNNGRSTTSNAFALAKLEPQRSRNPGLEFQFDRPGDYLLDLGGTYPEDAAEYAQEIRERHEDHKPQADIYEDERPEMEAWGLALQESIQNDRGSCEADDFHSNDWQNPGQGDDVLAKARDRGIGAILFDDGLYRLRYLNYRCRRGEAILNLAIQRAQIRDHHDSGVLVQSVIVPDEICGEKNPLHKFISELSDQGIADVEKTTGEPERRLTRQFLHRAKEDLLAELRRTDRQEALADLFCHDGWDYLAAFHFTGQLVHAILRSARELDPLCTEEQVNTPDSEGRQWLRSVQQDSSNPLNAMLWPEIADDALSGDYQSPNEDEPNEGDGRFRATELAKLEDQDLPDPDNLQTFDGELLYKATERGELLTVLTSAHRAGTQAIFAVHGELHAAVNSAAEAYNKHQSEYLALQRDQRALENERRSLEQTKAEANEQRQSAQREIDQREAAIERTQQQLDQRRQQINAEAVRARMRLYGPSLQQLRASVPRTLGQMRLERLSNALQGDYYILGLDNLPEERGETTRMFGNVRDGDGNAVATTNRRRARRMEIPDGAPRDALVAVLPANNQTARWISDIASAENRLVYAYQAASEARQSHNAANAAISRAADNLTDVAKRISEVKNNSALVMASVNEAEAQHSAATNNRLYRMLNTPALPVVVSIVEAVNVFSVKASLQRVRNERGLARAGFGVISAYYDLALATSLVADRFAQNTQVARVMGEWRSPAAAKLADRLSLRAITGRAVGGAIGGLLVAGLSFWDAAHAFRMGNNAGWGHTMAGAGGLAMGTAGFAGLAAKGILLGLGPVGWLVFGVSLTIGGFALAWWLEDEPMETWLRHGPFGERSEMPHLKVAEEAYYRLVGLLAGVRIDIRANTLRHKANAGSLEGLNEEDLTVLREANHVIHITSPVETFFSDADNTALDWHLQLRKTETRVNYKSRETVPRSNSETVSSGQYILGDRKVPSGREIYVKTPGSEREEKRSLGRHTMERTSYRWRVRAQARVAQDNHYYLFPAPPPDEKPHYQLTDPQSVTEHMTRDFNETGRVFWANESSS